MVYQLVTGIYVSVQFTPCSCCHPCTVRFDFHFINLPYRIYLFHFIEQMASSNLIPVGTSSMGTTFHCFILVCLLKSLTIVFYDDVQDIRRNLRRITLKDRRCSLLLFRPRQLRHNNILMIFNGTMTARYRIYQFIRPSLRRREEGGSDKLIYSVARSHCSVKKHKNIIMS